MPTSSPSAVESVAVRTWTMPLPAPLTVGSSTITAREYAAVQVRARDGVTGLAYCLTRGAPMAALVTDVVTPHLIGAQTDQPGDTWCQLFEHTALIGRVGLVRRALGLVDIALWDIAARRRGVPLWRLLGVGTDPRPAVLVAAYPCAGASADTIIAELRDRARQGWTLLKIARSDDHELMRAVLGRLGRDLPEGAGIIVDVAMAWRHAAQAIEELEKWGLPALRWLEDPFYPEDLEPFRQLRSTSLLTPTPIGAGDETTDPDVLRRLMVSGLIDVLRLDVVAIGGITPSLALIDDAKALGLPVSGHVYPEVTAHLGIGVETFDRHPSGNPYDPLPRLVHGGPDFAGGTAVPSSLPGLGFSLDLPDPFE